MASKFSKKNAPAMASLIARCVALSGPMPDVAAHKRYLATLSPVALEQRAAALESEGKETAPVRFWSNRAYAPALQGIS